MMKTYKVVTLLLITFVLLIGCGKKNPTTPDTDRNLSDFWPAYELLDSTDVIVNSTLEDTESRSPGTHCPGSI